MTDPQDWQLCASIISTAVATVTIPVTVKIRLQSTTAATLDFAVLLAQAGASVLTLHARQRGHEDRRRDGSADLCVVAAVVQRFQELGLGCLVLSNGNVRCSADVHANLASTAAAGVMVAEQLLRDPSVFSSSHQSHTHAGHTLLQPWLGKDLSLALDYCRCVEVASAGSAGRRCRMEDGATDGGNRGRRAARTVVEEGVSSEFERCSVWWTNYECVSGHLKHMLADARIEAEIKGVRSVKASLRILRRWARALRDAPVQGESSVTGSGVVVEEEGSSMAVIGARGSKD